MLTIYQCSVLSTKSNAMLLTKFVMGNETQQVLTWNGKDASILRNKLRASV